MNREKRQIAIQTFQNNPECSIFLATLKSAGVGLNLAAGNMVALIDSWWNPSAEDQVSFLSFLFKYILTHLCYKILCPFLII